MKVSHRATPGVPTARAKTIRVTVVRPSAGPGSQRTGGALLQDKLAALHYVVPRSGVYDAATGRAVMALRKLTGMSRTYIATEDVFNGAAGGPGRVQGPPPRRRPPRRGAPQLSRCWR